MQECAAFDLFFFLKILKFPRSLEDNLGSFYPAKLYISLTIHKSPIARRPIAASHSYITRLISILVHGLVKHCINMPTVLRDPMFRESCTTCKLLSCHAGCVHSILTLTQRKQSFLLTSFFERAMWHKPLSWFT